MRRRRGGIGVLTAFAVGGGALLSLTLFTALFVGLGGQLGSDGGCAAGSGSGSAVLAPGTGAVVGASEYGGPGDPSSGTVGSSGLDLASHPDSYAELGGDDFATATDLGGLAYGTPLRITSLARPDRSLVAYKEDIGFGGGPIDGRARVIDLWWELAGALGLPYEDGRWSGAVRIQRTPATGSADVLGASALAAAPVDNAPGPECGPAAAAGGLAVGTVAGPKAQLLGDGQAVAPATAPAAVKGIIAAGNQIAGKPYLYGGGHGTPLSEIAATYDCSSSVAHLLWGGGLLAVDSDMTAAEFESWGLPGPGRWVTLYASGDHVFMYVAGLRWDTHDAAGPGDGAAGIGWHLLVREDDGFVARHPAGL